MSYPGTTGEISATFRGWTDVEPLVRRTSQVRFVATGSLTNGEFGLFRWEMVAGAGGPGPHFHRGFSESFYVLEGRVSFTDGERWLVGGPGDFLYVPRGGLHGFRNDSEAAAAMLILFAPGTPRERFFSELAEIEAAGRELSPEEWRDFYLRHDQVNV
jgi:quercetin dioxygenase-like cupin family protein